MNSKVNNWAVELEQYNLKLDWIPGSKNLLADSLSRLIDVVPDAKQKQEPDGQEFGNFCFEELKPAELLEVAVTDTIMTDDCVEECIEHSIQSKDQSRSRQISPTTTTTPPNRKEGIERSIHSKRDCAGTKNAGH